MTLILALDCADGLLLASDGQATVSTGGQPVKTEADKLRRPWSNMGWGASGPVSVAQLVEQALGKHHSQATFFEKKTIAQIREAIAKTVTDTVRQAYQQHYQIPNQPGPDAEFLFVGDASDGPFMLEIHRNLLHTDHIKTGYTAIGSGDIFPYYAMAALKHYQVKQRPLREVKLIACRILEDAINTAAFGLGEPIQMIEIEKGKAGQCGVATKLRRADIQVLRDGVTQWKELEGESLTQFVGIRPIEDTAVTVPDAEEPPLEPSTS
jgi:proteasome beta subunit